MAANEYGLKILLVEQLQDLLSAENQLVAALPKMVDAAKQPKLKEAFVKPRADLGTLNVSKTRSSSWAIPEKPEPAKR